MQSSATSVTEYLASLPADRRAAIEAVRRVILEHLRPGFEEAMQFGMISYEVPRSYLADTYNGKPLPFVALAAQKNYMALYLMCVYSDPAALQRFEADYRASGKRLDMGKSCIRFRTLDDLPLDVIGRVIAGVEMDDFVSRYQASRAATAAGKRAVSAKKPASGGRSAARSRR